MSVVLFAGFLLTVWLLLWGTLSAANVLSGLLVAGLVLVILPESIVGDRKPALRPAALLRLGAYVVVEFVKANLIVAREIITPESKINTGVIEVPMPHASDSVLTFVSAVLSLSPGILPIEVDDDPGAIFIHVLHLDDVEKVRAEVQRLARLAIRAFGSTEAIAALDTALDTGDGCQVPSSEAER